MTIRPEPVLVVARTKGFAGGYEPDVAADSTLPTVAATAPPVPPGHVGCARNVERIRPVAFDEATYELLAVGLRRVTGFSARTVGTRVRSGIPFA